MNETLYQVLALVPALIMAIVFHEVAHGWVARALGDPTADRMGRLTLNPIRHVDPFGTLILPGLLAMTGAPVFGWAKPVPVNQRLLRDPRRGMMAVAAAGPGSNLVLAALGAIAMGLLLRLFIPAPGGVLEFVLVSLNYFLTVNIFLALFNLIPLPPFDGSHIVEGLLPRDAAASYRKLRPYGFPLLFLLLLVIPWLFPGLGIIERLILPPVDWLYAKYLGLAQAVSGY